MDKSSANNKCFDITKKHGSSFSFTLAALFDFLSSGFMFFFMFFGVIDNIKLELKYDNYSDISFSVAFCVVLIASMVASALTLYGVFSARRYYRGKSSFNGLRIVYYSLYASAILFGINWLFYFMFQMNLFIVIITVLLFLLIFYLVNIFAKTIKSVLKSQESQNPIIIKKDIKIFLIASTVILGFIFLVLIVFYVYSFITSIFKLLDIMNFISYTNEYSTLGMGLIILIYPIIPKFISNIIYLVLIFGYNKDIAKI